MFQEEKKSLPVRRTKKPPTIFFLGPRLKMLRAQNRVLRCAQPGLSRLLRKTAIFTKMLRQRDSGICNYIPGLQQYVYGCAPAGYVYTSTSTLRHDTPAMTHVVRVRPPIPTSQGTCLVGCVVRRRCEMVETQKYYQQYSSTYILGRSDGSTPKVSYDYNYDL